MPVVKTGSFARVTVWFGFGGRRLVRKPGREGRLSWLGGIFPGGDVGGLWSQVFVFGCNGVDFLFVRRLDCLHIFLEMILNGL